ncbi:hypothetical protein [Microlunatus sp. Gsoil 973]|nr:hypothetical protein [Microlunatus sp. Gsoil 973]
MISASVPERLSSRDLTAISVFEDGELGYDFGFMIPARHDA